MKINWGVGVIIAFLLFMSFILYFVIKVQTDTKYDNDLVVEEYYKQELHFQDQLNREQNAKNLKNDIQIETKATGIEIVFPAEFNPKDISGTVSLYRPSDKKLDFEAPISLSDSHLLIPNRSLLDGRWDIIINWKVKDQSFYSKKVLNHKL
ncbi:FixH family protein [Flavobacterium sp. '19STA2R22 D10 B1']|uniref:FixH family protein n=1 Tax=Flavobacterium aerium TaxID=3037261 RepID=UPI00278C6B61|nr:FixH family protein [Flavobacterium sp. '19STA2R22 D10 B1']